MTPSTPPATLSDTEAAAYLARLGTAAPEAPTLAALTSLHRTHLVAVPFETLDISLGRPVRLDLASLLSKVVDARRGGYCYELNGLFAALLRHLGYAVDLVSARVATSDGGLTDPFDHLALVVNSPVLDGPVLADVGFGDGFIEPLPLRHGVVAHERGKDVGLVREGGWLALPRARGRREVAHAVRLHDRAAPARGLRAPQPLATDVAGEPLHAGTRGLTAHPHRAPDPPGHAPHHDDAWPPRGGGARRGRRARSAGRALRHRDQLMAAGRRH